MSCETCKCRCPTAGKPGGQVCGFYRAFPRRTNLIGRKRCSSCNHWLGKDLDKPARRCRICWKIFCEDCLKKHSH